MIGSLRGTLIERTPRRDAKDAAVDVLIECGGVGYRAIMPATSAMQLGELGTAVFVHVHTHVREDALILYAFGSHDERDSFAALISAHGIGPSVALAILGTHSPAALIRIIHGNDVEALCSVPGIGKKTAAKLLIELQSRLDFPIVDITELSSVSAEPETDARKEVRAALAGLGYSTDEIRSVVDAASSEIDSQTLLRESLKKLAVSR